MSQIKAVSDQLALSGAQVDDEDLILLTLKCLPDEYDAFKTSIRTRSTSVSMEELCSLLGSEEIHIESKIKHLSNQELHVAYSTTKGSSSGSVFDTPSFNFGSNSRTTTFNNFRGRAQHRGSRGGRYPNNFRGGNRTNRILSIDSDQIILVLLHLCVRFVENQDILL